MNFLLFLCFIVTILFLAVGAAKVFNPTTSWENAARVVKDVIVSVVKGFFYTPPIRRVFDEILTFDLIKIVDPYRNTNFDVQIAPANYNGAPCLAVRFIANEGMSSDNMLYIANLFKRKFREYLGIYGLDWQNFVIYLCNDNEVTFGLIYAEFPGDMAAFEKVYRRAMSSPKENLGVLRDEVLEKELGGNFGDEN